MGKEIVATEAKNLHQRIIECGNQIKYLEKEDRKVNNQYFAMSYNAVMEKIAPVLRQHGVVLYADVLSYQIKEQIKDGKIAGYFCEMAVGIKIVNADAPEETQNISSFVVAWDTLDKAADKAYSKAVRQCLQKLFLLPTYDEKELSEAPDMQEAVAPEKYTLITPEQVTELKKMAEKTGVAEEIVARAGGADSGLIKDIVSERYESVYLRLFKKIEQMGM